MVQRYVYAAWLISTILATSFVYFRRSRQNKRGLKLNEILELSLTVFGGVSALYLASQTWLHFNELQELVSLEGIVSITLGIFSSIWFCIRAIVDLAKKS